MPIILIAMFFTINIIQDRQESQNAKELETAQESISSGTQEEQQSVQAEQSNQENQSEKNAQSKETESTNEKWKIEIPEISLIANIAEGTDDETLSKFVGHFTSTPKEEGNIGLAAHNRGYPVNYFANLKNLKGGEEITYTYGDFTKTYVVLQNIKISDIDWSYLENSNENKITLITCIENEPAYRRCVQAIEKEEN